MEREEWLGSNGVHLRGPLGLLDEVETSFPACLQDAGERVTRCAASGLLRFRSILPGWRWLWTFVIQKFGQTRSQLS